MTDAFLRPCRGLPLREQPFWMILKLFRTACCSGEASRNGLEDWESCSLRLPYCLFRSGQSGAFLGGGYGGDARQDSSENQRHGTMSVDGISRADCGRNCTAADWWHGFV